MARHYKVQLNMARAAVNGNPTCEKLYARLMKVVSDRCQATGHPHQVELTKLRNQLGEPVDEQLLRQ